MSAKSLHRSEATVDQKKGQEPNWLTRKLARTPNLPNLLSR